MISFLKGIVTSKTINSAILDISGVGYQVLGTVDFISSLPQGREAAVFTYLYVREDQLTLYGFKTQDELEFFKLLLAVSGVGPKSALEILSQASVDQLKQAVIKAQPDIFFGASGVGKKTASKIVLDLQSKIGRLEDLSLEAEMSTQKKEAVEALVGLGYKRKEALTALKDTDPALSPEEQIKAALKKV